MTVSWPRDDAKLDRVRALMGEHDLDALVVRAPDNVLYLTNFWGMKGYDACVFPREGEPVLITIEASEEDAARMAWTQDVRFIKGYDPADPSSLPKHPGFEAGQTDTRLVPIDPFADGERGKHRLLFLELGQRVVAALDVRAPEAGELDGLAAAAAHALGTPLSTITLIARELEREIDPGSPHAEDIKLLREQTQRCRDILSKITQLTFGAISPGNIPTNLMTANISAGATSHAGDLLLDLKSGYILGANPRQQFLAQFPGTDVMFQVAGETGNGVLQAACAAGGRSIRRSTSPPGTRRCSAARTAGRCSWLPMVANIGTRRISEYSMLKNVSHSPVLELSTRSPVLITDCAWPLERRTMAWMRATSSSLWNGLVM